MIAKLTPKRNNTLNEQICTHFKNNISEEMTRIKNIFIGKYSFVTEILSEINDSFLKNLKNDQHCADVMQQVKDAEQRVNEKFIFVYLYIV
jgi:hypothetical protein